MQNIRVLVLRGGSSEEFDVSMNTGSSVLDALDTNKYEPIDVVITKNGEWLVDGYVKFPEQILNMSDIVFIALHGAYGEDGTVQRILDIHSIPYTGSGAYSSCIAMHKALTKDYLRDSNVKMAPHLAVTINSLDNLYGISNSIAEMFGPRYVIKPTTSGSSIGVIMVDNAQLLSKALKEALSIYDEIIVEKRISGREATCGVIENYRGEKYYVLPPIEIIPPTSADFFNNKVKYDNTTNGVCPGRFTDSEKKTIAEFCKICTQKTWVIWLFTFRFL